MKRTIFSFTAIAVLAFAIFSYFGGQDQPRISETFVTVQPVKAWRQVPSIDSGISMAPDNCDIYEGSSLRIYTSEYGQYWETVRDFPFRTEWIAVKEIDGDCAGWVNYEFLRPIGP